MKYLPLIFLLPLWLCSCSSSKNLKKDIVYFQTGMDSMAMVQFQEPVIQNNDLLSIQVFSGALSQEQAAIFNIPNGSATPSVSTGTAAVSTATAAPGYQVDMEGNIEMPIIGQVKAAGLTRTQLADNIAGKLQNQGLVKNPLVLVKFNQFHVNVLGEVNHPGVMNFNTDRANLMDALAQAGDLKDEARRDNILVIREHSGQRSYYKLDLRSASVFQSPAFHLQQNDIIYVSARDTKLKNLNVNPNFQRNFSLILSTVSTLISIGTFIIVTTR